jgi:hypothetical protein
MKRLFTLSVCAIALAAPATCLAGPFGFYYGETPAAATLAVGGASHVKQGPLTNGLLKFDRAPASHPEFESYHLWFSPTKGLLKIVAIGKDVDTNRSGDQIRSEYTQLQAAVTATYGVATSYDVLVSGSIWTDPNDWTESILKKDRRTDSFWTPSTASQDHLTSIELSLAVLNATTGYLVLSYEYEGWDAYSDALDSKKNSVL